MGTGYTRQSAADIITGANITAAPLNAEFNAIQSAFDSSTGHSHDGTSGEGPLIDLTTSITGYLPAANGGVAGKNKVDGTTAPTSTDDTGSGYAPGSIWVDITNDNAYVCLDATSTAAVWERVNYIIGTDVQAYDAGLLSIAALTTAADKMIYTTASDTYAVTDLTSTARTLLDDTSTSAMRTTLGLAIGSDVQAYDAGLADIAGLAVTDGNIIVGNGANWVAESGATARTSLGLAIGIDVQAYDAELAAIAGLTSAANKVPMFSGSGTATLLDFKDEDNMASDSATAVASQQSIKAYVDAATGGSTALDNLSDVTITSVTNDEVLQYTGAGWENQTLTEAGIQDILAEGAFVDGDKTKLDGIETGADVTDTANVTAAGALMDSELTSETAVKALTTAMITEQADAVWEAGTGTTASIVAPDAIAAAIAALGGGGGETFNSMQVFTTSGTWTRPSGVTKVHMIVIGGGGGSGDGGSGSGAGGEAEKILDVTSIASSTITVGSGGSGNSGGGSNGGNSSWADGTNTITGGGGSAGDNSAGAGGTASGGDWNMTGVSGDTASKGWGADSRYGQGGGTAESTSVNGHDAAGYGAGGGGVTNATRSGGSGAPGIVIVYEYAG